MQGIAAFSCNTLGANKDRLVQENKVKYTCKYLVDHSDANILRPPAEQRTNQQQKWAEANRI